MQSGVISDVYRSGQGSKGQFVIVGPMGYYTKVTPAAIESLSSEWAWACKSCLSVLSCYIRIYQTCTDSQYFMFFFYYLENIDAIT